MDNYELRNLQKSGNSYSINLPMNWVKQLGKPKNIIVRQDDSGNLILSAKEPKKIVSEKEVVIERYDPALVNRIITALYIDGYDKYRIVFSKPITNKEMLRHRRFIEELGFAQELVEIDINKAVFRIQPGFLPPVEHTKNQLKKVLNFMRLMEQDEIEVAKKLHTDILKGGFLLFRLMNTYMKNPQVLRQFETKPEELLFFTLLVMKAEDTCRTLLDEGLKQELPVIKKLFELTMINIEKKDFDLFYKISNLLPKIKHEKLNIDARKIQRYLIDYCLA